MESLSDADIRKAFEEFDADENGFIGASDIYKTFLSLNENLTYEEVRAKVLSTALFDAYLVLLCSLFLLCACNR